MNSLNVFVATLVVIASLSVVEAYLGGWTVGLCTVGDTNSCGHNNMQCCEMKVDGNATSRCVSECDPECNAAELQQLHPTNKFEDEKCGACNMKYSALLLLATLFITLLGN